MPFREKIVITINDPLFATKAWWSIRQNYPGHPGFLLTTTFRIVIHLAVFKC